MARQIVMDHSGDTKHEFDVKNSAEVKEAMERFNTLVGRGYTAATRSAPGEQPKVTRAFDPTVEETLFIPRLAGG